MRFGLIGEHLAHSYSPEIHRRLRGYAYELCPMAPEALPAFFARRAFSGINVTIPYKQTAMPYCDALSETARRVGAVNTVVRRADGTLFGDNTDPAGFRFMLREAGIDLAGKRVLVLGSGGASLTVRLVAAEMGAKSVAVIGRGGFEGMYAHENAQVVVNATPVGMFPHGEGCPARPDRFPALEAVLDLVYNPLRTRLLQGAQALGLETAGGLPMLVAQAAASAELFTGEPCREGEAARVLASLRRDLENWVLVGMPGCGKTSLGRRLAARSGRPFVDLDLEIEKEAGRPAREIFSAQGEAAFRDLEAQMAARFGAGTGQVIATGGGAVLRPGNAEALRGNGRLLWIRRDTRYLATAGRPLSVDLENLERARRPFYEAAADMRMDHNENWETLFEGAWEGFNP
ncbi:MAG: shikimate kinase [Oscillospiraceae bacterium]|jgi:shikimate dehydrogenase|nr:shikimate kinase [Oscillospiraceae bacterium]